MILVDGPSPRLMRVTLDKCMCCRGRVLREWCVRANRSVAAALAVALAVSACGGDGESRGDEAVRFGFFGDMPYRPAEVEAMPALIDQMNDASLDVSIFVGDLFDAACVDSEYATAIRRFNTFDGPLVYVPGDNEWTDCHYRGGDPLDRLAYIRQTMFATNKSFGRRPIELEQQRPDYPENGRWRVGRVLFVSVNVTGSNNNHFDDPHDGGLFDFRGPSDRQAAEDEYLAREDAVRIWLQQSFSVAQRENAPAVVVAMHADPGFRVPSADRATARVNGFDRFLVTLAVEAKAYGKPVVLIHGDSHQFIHDQPLVDHETGRRLANVTRIETIGNPSVGWTEVVLDPANAAGPAVQPHQIPLAS